ncbi:hypothetical protein CYMTET_45559, partial [Cymbomonas tetramitiformis]
LSDLTSIILDVKRQLKLLTDKDFLPFCQPATHMGGFSDCADGGLSITAEGRELAMRYMNTESETDPYDSDADESATECEPADATPIDEACAPDFAGLEVGGVAVCDGSDPSGAALTGWSSAIARLHSTHFRR